MHGSGYFSTSTRAEIKEDFDRRFFLEISFLKVRSLPEVFFGRWIITSETAIIPIFWDSAPS